MYVYTHISQFWILLKKFSLFSSDFLHFFLAVCSVPTFPEN